MSSIVCVMALMRSGLQGSYTSLQARWHPLAPIGTSWRASFLEGARPRALAWYAATLGSGRRDAALGLGSSRGARGVARASGGARLLHIAAPRGCAVRGGQRV